MESYFLLAVLAGIFGLFMAWGIGANDVANAMGTSVGSRALTIRQAILVAAIFEFLGAVLAGGQVTETIRKGIVEPAAFAGRPEELVYGMLAALLAAGVWLAVASARGWPVSTTHSIVGAVVGFTIVALGVQGVEWGKVGAIAASWVTSPLVAAFLAFAIYQSVRWLILDQDDPIARARRYVPLYMFLAAFVITVVTITKGLKHVGLEVGVAQGYLIAAAIGAAVAAVGGVVIRRVRFEPVAPGPMHFGTLERIFGVLMVCTACGLAFAHGSNDVANAIGPVAAVISVASTGTVGQSAPLPIWVLLIGGVGIVAGLATFGVRVIRTIGEKITELTPSKGFAAELAASSTIVFASSTGMPISTTHTLVGAVLGVGLARGVAALDLRVLSKIVLSWVVTIPVGAVLAIVFFLLLRALFGLV